MMTEEFYKTSAPDPHTIRRKRIRKKYPEIKKLYGQNIYSAFLVLVLVAVQFFLSALLREQPFWLIFLASYFIGAYISIALFALIHDASHNLIFQTAANNKVIAIIANLPLVIVGAIPFFRYHHAHHAHFNDYNYDVGLPTEWEAKWVGNRSIRKMLWLAFFPVFQWQRTYKYKTQKRFIDGWMMVNAAAQVSVDILIFWVLGIEGFVYLLLSFSWSFGLHPLGTRVVQEHFIVKPGQESNNYTGHAKIFECNFGLHAEHHDFPTIPWNRLPKLNCIASGEYDEIHKFKSRLVLMFDFIFNPNWSLYQNTLRVKGEE